ncbi:MAG: hypothetical protein IKL09_00400, partial [Clostridia bacterium]|nr:hypothetical protein [Clostridia bacterium]
DAETNTLTLKKAKINCGNFRGYGDFVTSEFACIVATKGLNIVLEGKNTLNTIYTSGYGTDGIFCYTGDLNISGDGQLNIEVCGYTDGVSYGIYSGGTLNIKDTTVNIDMYTRNYDGTVGLSSGNINIKNSEVNISADDVMRAYGISSPDVGDLLETDNAKLNININDCKYSCGIEIFSITFKNSDVDVYVNFHEIAGVSTIPTFGIYTMTLLIQESYVDSVVDTTSKSEYTGALIYRYFMLDDDSNPDYISGVSGKVRIEPNKISYDCIGLYYGRNSGLGLDVYGYISDSGIVRADEDTWNIYIDSETNTLYLKNVNITTGIDIDGFVNIVIEGENVIHTDVNYGVGLKATYAPVISGNGTLKIYSDNGNAVSAAGGLLFGENTSATASMNADGSDSESFDNTKSGQYKRIEIKAEGKTELTFWQKIAQFFEDLFASIRDFFANLFQ